MIHDPWFYAAAIPAVIILGLSKGGFTALGLLAVPIMALAISPVQAAGITLPLLVISDIVALISYRGLYDRATLKLMIPSAIVGIAVGWATAAWVTEHEIRLIVGLISILFAVNHWFRGRLQAAPHEQHTVKGWFWGIITGFTSFVSHAGGPPFQMYAVPLQLDPRIFAGTSVILFAIINAVKLVPYFFLGQFAPENLETAAVLLAVAFPSTLLGVWLVKRFDPRTFYNVIYVSIFLVGVYLVWEAIAELFWA